MSEQSLSSLISELDKFVFSLPSTPILFNQYHDISIGFDLDGASQIRKDNLISYLKSVERTAKVLVIGEAAGPWGCRFSGVPFVGEKQYLTKQIPFIGKRSSMELDTKFKYGSPFISPSSKMFWDVMRDFYPRFLTWDCVPLHPHKLNEPLSVRNPTIEEIKKFLPALESILRFLKPEKIIAVGKKAEIALTEMGIKGIYVRHPSRGGFSEFKKGMRCQIL